MEARPDMTGSASYLCKLALALMPVASSSVCAAADSQTPVARMDHIAAKLHDRLNNPNLEAGILANIERETGGRFDHSIKQSTGCGYGLMQYTGAALRGYRAWLALNGRADSADSQIDYFVDEYMPTRRGYRVYTAAGAAYSKEQYADWIHRRVFTPAHTIPSNRAYSRVRINRATRRHNAFMRNRLHAVNGVWRAVKTSEGRS